MSTIKWVIKYVEKYKFRLFVSFFMVFICSLLNMVNPYMSGKIVDDVIKKGNTKLLIPIIIIMILVTLIRTGIKYIYLMNFEKISQNVMFNIRMELYTKIQDLDFDFFDRTRTGDIMTRMTSDVETVRHFVSWVIYQVFENAAIFIFAIIFMFTISYKLTLILLMVTPLTAFFACKLAFDVKPTFGNIREQFSKLNTVVEENISGNRVIKAFTKEDYEIEKFSKQNEAFKQSNLKSAKVWEKYLPILDSLGGLLVIIIILFGGILVIKNSITIGQLVTFNSLIFAVNNPLRMVGWLTNDIQKFNASAEKIMLLLNSEAKIKNSTPKIKNQNLKGIVEFDDVSFCYGDEPVINNISFKAKPGQTIGIIGPTGSGKSTIVNLICRFYDCSDGEIRIDGFNVKDIYIKKLRESIAVAMQDIFLFSDTIEGNIAYGVPDIPFEKVKWAADIAGASNFIEGFSEGYDTIIGERGVGLSGGQKQRIALARALIKNPSILILDDTTSSVDIETENQIQKSLKSYYKNKTTFIIAHRISSVKNADMILVINEGRIIEQGKHKELLSNKGYYYSVYMNQSGNFDTVDKKEVC